MNQKFLKDFIKMKIIKLIKQTIMKKLLFTSLLALGLLLPTTYSASTNSTSSTEFSTKKPRKSSTSRKSARVKKAKSYSSSRSSSRSSRSYARSNDGCTYGGHQLYVGSRGGCYYYSGNSKQYVDRSYCSSCN